MVKLAVAICSRSTRLAPGSIPGRCSFLFCLWTSCGWSWLWSCGWLRGGACVGAMRLSEQRNVGPPKFPFAQGREHETVDSLRGKHLLYYVDPICGSTGGRSNSCAPAAHLTESKLRTSKHRGLTVLSIFCYYYNKKTKVSEATQGSTPPLQQKLDTSDNNNRRTLAQHRNNA